MAPTGRPVVFIHGLWLYSTSWTPWVELFTQRGYQPMAPGWPGVVDTVEAARADPDSIADHGIDVVAAHYAQIIDELPQPPILVGHSFGGMIAEKLLGQNRAAAAVAIDAAQIKGVLPLPLSALRVTFPVFRNPANKHRAVSPTADQFRFAFGNAVDEDESQDLYERWTIPPGKPLFEASVSNFSPHSPAKVDTDNADRGPSCSSRAARITPFPRPSRSRPSSNTVAPPRSPTSRNSPTAVTRSPSTADGARLPTPVSPGWPATTCKPHAWRMTHPNPLTMSPCRQACGRRARWGRRSGRGARLERQTRRADPPGPARLGTTADRCPRRPASGSWSASGRTGRCHPRTPSPRRPSPAPSSPAAAPATSPPSFTWYQGGDVGYIEYRATSTERGTSLPIPHRPPGRRLRWRG